MTSLLHSRNISPADRATLALLLAVGLQWLAEVLRAVHPPIAWRLQLKSYILVALASSLSRPLFIPSPTAGQLLGAFTWAGSPSFVRIAQSRHL
jgi:hypothetical protein